MFSVCQAISPCTNIPLLKFLMLLALCITSVVRIGVYYKPETDSFWFTIVINLYEVLAVFSEVIERGRSSHDPQPRGPDV